MIGRTLASAADLAEAEGRLLRAHTARMGAAASLLIGATCFGVAGAGLLVAALFFWLRSPLGPTGAAAVCGGVCLAITAGVGALARRLA
jgi:hypothetical protein